MSDTGYIRDPQAIEAESFAIIDAEAGEHAFSDSEWPVVRRVIHTTADFEFVDSMFFTPGALDAGIAAVGSGAKVYCDTNMVRAGINKNRLAEFGGSVHCYVADADVAEQARTEGVTRSIVALRKGVQAGCQIFLIGNAPTALYELLRFCREEGVKPELIVGAPVGFVGAAESKQALVESGLPQITCRGRKGGSAIAAAIFNAIVLLAKDANG